MALCRETVYKTGQNFCFSTNFTPVINSALVDAGCIEVIIEQNNNMRRLIIPVLAILLISCAQKNEEGAKISGQELFFTESTYNFGEMMEDGPGTFKIEFKNIGDQPIVINRVRSSCGCTIPSWPKEPVEPGKNGEIEVKYNTALTGSFLKSVYVYSTAANSPVKLLIKGKVIPKDKTQ